MSCNKACLLNGANANGSGDVAASHGSVNQVVVTGVMNGATVTIEGSPDGTNWAPIKAITALGHYSMPFTRGQVRATVSSVGGSTEVSVHSYYDPDALVVFP